MDSVQYRSMAVLAAGLALVFLLGSPGYGESPSGGGKLYAEQLGRAMESLLAMRIEEGEGLIDTWIGQYPERPAGYFFRSSALSWRLFLEPEDSQDKSVRKAFERAVSDCRQYAEKYRSRPETRFEGVLYLGAVYGQEALLALLDRRYLVLAPPAKMALNYIKEAISLDPGYYDCYFGLGVYQYFTDILPDMVKMLALVFGFEGDRSGGLANLRLASERGLYSRDAAKIMLMNLYSTLEAPDSSVQALALELNRRYPDNPLIHWRYGDILLRRRQFEAALKVYAQVAERIEKGYPYYRNKMFSAWSISFRQGMCDKRLGLNREALEHFVSITSSPKVTPEWIVSQAWLASGEIYLQEGKKEPAVRALNAVLDYADEFGSHDRASQLLKTLEGK